MRLKPQVAPAIGCAKKLRFGDPILHPPLDMIGVRTTDQELSLLGRGIGETGDVQIEFEHTQHLARESAYGDFDQFL